MSIHPLIVRLSLLLCLLMGSPSLWAQESAEEPVDAPRAGDQQPDRRFRGEDRMLGMLPLLRVETVREELGVDDEQSKALETVTVEIREDFGGQIRGFLQGLHNLSPEQRRARRREGNEEMSRIRTKVGERLKGVLGEPKFRRLEEIEVQRLVRTSGISALASRDIAAALDLTGEQKKELRAQAEVSRGQGESISLDEVRAQVKEVLTAEQIEKLDTLFGAEFDLPQELLERRRGRLFGRQRRDPSGRRRGQSALEAEQPATDGANPE